MNDRCKQMCRDTQRATEGGQGHPGRFSPWIWEFQLDRYYHSVGKDWKEVALNRAKWARSKHDWLKFMVNDRRAVNLGKDGSSQGSRKRGSSPGSKSGSNCSIHGPSTPKLKIPEFGSQRGPGNRARGPVNPRHPRCGHLWPRRGHGARSPSPAGRTTPAP